MCSCQITYAETVYENKSFNENTTLVKSGSPYHLYGSTRIDKDVTVTIQQGVTIYIHGTVNVNQGTLNFEGASTSRVTFVGDNISYNAPTLVSSGGKISLSYVDVKSEGSLLQAFNNSVTHVQHSKIIGDLGQTTRSGSLVSLWGSSTLYIDSSVLSDTKFNKGIEAFNSSIVDIQSTDIHNLGTEDTITVYDSTSIPNGRESSLYIDKVNITGSSTYNGITLFNSVKVSMSLSNISEFKNSGIQLYSGSSVDINKTALFNNEYAIRSFNSIVSVQDSDIFSNRTAGIYAYGGTVHAPSNWWGDESGPYHNTQNISGKGNAYVGEGGFTPWSIKNKEKCCSSVLFIPGIQGSRLYKNSLIGENQLWEPNYHSDIKKLLMNTAGKAIDSGIYTRDIIERTNITQGGSFDVDVYDGFVEFLNDLQKNYSIEDFSVFPYDWRSSAKDIAVYGTRYKTDKNVIVHRQLTQEIERLSTISKTKKVTLISHSYGGLVIKELLHALYLSGKISLIDKVIFVGAPDNGSLMSLGSLLHGDNQDIGHGLIVNTYTMREFAQNLPSVYLTLPKSSEQIISGIASSSTVYKPIPDITGVEQLRNFLKNTAQRPTDTYFREINVPPPVNSMLLDSYFRAGSGLTSVPDVEENVSKGTSYFSAYPGIQFFNILGVGIPTPRVLEYVQKRCPAYISHPVVNSKNCGLDHRYIDSNVGDGVVLAEDALQQDEFSQNRWGEKYVINIGEYNRKHVSNFSHSTLVSSPPVVSLLSRIITNSIDSPGLPAYVTKHGGVRSSVNSVQGFAGDIGPTAQHDYVLIEHSDFMRSSIFEYATSTESYYNLIDINPLFIQVVPKKPNTQTRLVSDVIQIRSESNANKMVLSMSEYVRNPDPAFDLRIKTVSGSTSSTVSFVGVPVSENSIVTVTREGEDAHMKIENVYDQVATTSVEYILNKDNSALIHSEDFPPFREVLDRAMVEIRSSNLRNNFKDRYVRKIESIKNKYFTYEAEKRTTIRSTSYVGMLNSKNKVTTYTEQIKKSVQAIHAELHKTKISKYKGGMLKAEAAFLRDQFLYIQRALVYNLEKL